MTGGRFIVLEGGDGVGKTTQAARLADHLGAVLTREPGGTTLGVTLRSLVLDRASAGLVARAEALIMAADRAQHVAEVVRPALAAGRHVVSDRYLYSSVAYQGYGRSLPPDEIARLSLWAAEGLQPDLVVLLERPRVVRAGDRLEDEDEAFHARVVAGYRAQAAAEPDRWAVLAVDGTIDEVAGRLFALVNQRLGLERADPR